MFALTRARCAPARRGRLIQADIYDESWAGRIRTKAVRQGDPLDTETMIGAQATNDQLEDPVLHRDRQERGAKVVTGGERAELGGDSSGGDYVEPTIFTGNNKMRIFQEEIFGRRR